MSGLWSMNGFLFFLMLAACLLYAFFAWQEKRKASGRRMLQRDRAEAQSSMWQYGTFSAVFFCAMLYFGYLVFFP